MERTKTAFKFMILLTMFLSVLGLEQDVPMVNYEFTNISNGAIYTTAENIRFHGNVTLEHVGNSVYIAVPSGSYLVIEDNMTRTCIDHIDNCTSGFSLKSYYSFSDLDTNATQVVITTGAGLEEGAKGVSLYFQSGQVYAHVVTSTQQWSIEQPFTMADNELFDMTVSWHPSKGLWLFQGNDTIGSDINPSVTPTKANVSNPLVIGSPEKSSSGAVQHVRKLVTRPIYCEELEKCFGLIVISSNDSSELMVGDILAIVGVSVSVLLAVFACVCLVLGKLSEKGKKPLEKPEVF